MPTDVLALATPGAGRSADGAAVRITFVLPAGLARHAQLVAEFTSWTPIAMDRLRDGSHRATVVLPAGERWGYRFVLDDDTIVNDPGADEFDRDPDLGVVSVVRT